ncbi:MAG: hypothetical protein H6665_00395 [Ardenticatenaceae bacterium]|nr:hypothetical protein [Ardenticatenaceae bacterium]
MSIIHPIAQLLLFFASWFIPILVVAVFIWRRRRAGKLAAVLVGILLLLTAGAYAGGDISWRLFPALVRGYHYDPGIAAPDTRLVPRRPELIIERQLAALLGQTGAAPLDPHSPLADYTIDMVHIDGWANDQWVTAVLDTTLTFADGHQEYVELTLPAKGGSYLLVPFFGEVNRSAYTWYAPESSLAPLLQTPAPVTTLRDDMPPLTLQLVETVDVSALPGVDPEASFVTASDLSASGTLLADINLHRGEVRTGNAVLRHADGAVQQLAETWFVARALFSPDGQRIAYIFSQRNRPFQLVVREADGKEQVVTAVAWMTHHWVGHDQIAYSDNVAAYLVDLNSGETRFLVTLPPYEFMGGQRFRVSPNGERIAYMDENGRLWVKALPDGEPQPIGWDVTNISWEAGLTWRDDGQQLLFISRDIVTLPNQQEVWLWDATSGATTLIARDGPHFLGNSVDNPANLVKSCWLDDKTVLLVAYAPAQSWPLAHEEATRLLAAHTDGSGIWDVTPNGQFVASEVRCANGQVALNTSGTTINLYQVQP